MDYRNLIMNGKSVRDFKDKEVDAVLFDQIKEYVADCKKLVPQIEVELDFYGHEAYDKLQGVAGYKGHMLNAPSYMLVLSEGADNDIENAGYIGERAILKARDLGLDSCWITFDKSDDVKEKLSIVSDKIVLGIIALGYGEEHQKVIKGAAKVGDNYSKADTSIEPENEGTRLDIEQIVFMDKWGINADLDALEQRALFDAFSIVRMAPSSLNKQPWRFIVDGGRVILCINNPEYKDSYANRIDAGIAMLYFSIILDITLFDSKWGFEAIDRDKYGIPADFAVVGYCNI